MTSALESYRSSSSRHEGQAVNRTGATPTLALVIRRSQAPVLEGPCFGQRSSPNLLDNPRRGLHVSLTRDAGSLPILPVESSSLEA